MNDQILLTVIGFHSLVLLFPISMVLLWKWPKLWHQLLALVLGVLIGFLDLRSDDPQFAVLLLLMFGSFLGFAQPERAWRGALILGAGVPIFQFLKITIEGTSGKLLTEAIFSVLAFIPPIIGVYTGVVIQGKVHRGEKPTTKTNV